MATYGLFNMYLGLYCAMFFIANALGHPITVTKSGATPVAQYETAIYIYLQLTNRDDSTYNVSITPESCCLIIETDDIDCKVKTDAGKIMVLNNRANMRLDRQGIVTFPFYNLYSRYRKGSCKFTIRFEGPASETLKHTVDFDTYPDDGVWRCSGIDQDPDRDCTPVDCAIKYKGARNFYRNSTGKCEPAVYCNTLASDGRTVIAFYDWENNVCQKLDWVQRDNYADQIESDALIPTQLKSSRNAGYYPGFEPQLLGEDALNCNNGYQEGSHCVCDDGWISSGIHGDNVLTFHWCDVTKVDPYALSMKPRRLTGPQEALAVIALLVANVIFVMMWVCIVSELWSLHCCGFSPLRAVTHTQACKARFGG